MLFFSLICCFLFANASGHPNVVNILCEIKTKKKYVVINYNGYESNKLIVTNKNDMFFSRTYLINKIFLYAT